MTSPATARPLADWIYHPEIIFNQETVRMIQQELAPLDLTSSYAPSPSIGNYFRYYELDHPDSLHYFGSFSSGGKNIAAHVFMPLPSSEAGSRQTEGTVMLVHGYLDHTGAYTKLIDALLDKNYTVCSVDLPGHGFSDGERGSIDDFAEYGELISNLYAMSKTFLPAPYHIIGYSTGCSAIIEYLLSRRVNPFATCIFIAPLIRSQGWGIIGCGVNLLGGFISRLPAIFSNSASNRDYVKFVKDYDPLEVKNVTTLWAKAMFRWNERLATYQPGKQQIVVIQGTKDKAVDYTYNLPVLQQLFPRHEIHYIEGAGHTLCSETLPFRTKTFQLIFQTLEQEKREMPLQPN